MKRLILFGVLMVAGLVALLFVPIRIGHRTPHSLDPSITWHMSEPALMLWAWEVPENLTALDPKKAGVAFLAREVLLSDRMTVRPRMQPLKVAPGTYMMAVVRIETAPGFIPSEEVAQQTAGAIVDAYRQTGATGLQVDFDALASQRKFYADVLKLVKERQGPDKPLSITALMSWCGSNSWLDDLLVDEAVPMMFRMGGPAVTRAVAPRSTAGIESGRCSMSVGIATDEVWPEIAPDKRVYVFRSGSWTKDDIAKINSLGYQSLRQ